MLLGLALKMTVIFFKNFIKLIVKGEPSIWHNNCNVSVLVGRCFENARRLKFDFHL